MHVSLKNEFTLQPIPFYSIVFQKEIAGHFNTVVLKIPFYISTRANCFHDVLGLKFQAKCKHGQFIWPIHI